nr:hypothetical protein [Actinoplanes sp. ATCC 53533]
MTNRPIRRPWSARSAAPSSGLQAILIALLEELGLAELTHDARNYRIRAR